MSAPPNVVAPFLGCPWGADAQLTTASRPQTDTTHPARYNNRTIGRRAGVPGLARGLVRRAVDGADELEDGVCAALRLVGEELVTAVGEHRELR